MIPNRGTDCSQPGCMEMVGIMQSVPVIRSPQSTKLLPLLCTTASIGLFEPIGTISQLIYTAARCTLRIESPDPILSNGATAQTASLNQQHLRPEILFCLSCLFPTICLILLMSKGQIRWWGESFRLRANCYLCASPVLRTSSLAGKPRHHGPRCTGIGRNKQGVFLKGFVPSWNNTWYRFTELSADMQSTPREILHQQIFAVLARAGCTRTGTYSTFGYALANHV